MAGTGPSDFALELGRRLRDARNRAGLSLSEVETRTRGEFSACAAGSYERGDRAPTVERLSRLAEVYGAGVVDLLPGAPLVTETFTAITAAARDRVAALARDYDAVYMEPCDDPAGCAHGDHLRQFEDLIRGAA